MYRTVQFFRITTRMENDLPYSFPAARLVRRLQNMEESGIERKFECKDGMELLAEGTVIDPFPSLAIYRTRRANLPRLEERGVISDLPLGDAQALAEVTYFGFVGRNIVAVIYNHEGPRAKRLSSYVSGMFDFDMGMIPILRDDLSEVLERMRMTAIEIAIPAAQIPDLVAPGDDWARVLDDASHLMSDGIIKMSVSVGRSGGSDAKASRSRRIRELVTQLFSNREDLAQFSGARVNGVDLETNRPQSINLLEQIFITQVDIPDEEMTTIGQASAAAVRYLQSEWEKNQRFLTRNTPEVPPNGVAPDLVGPRGHNSPNV